MSEGLQHPYRIIYRDVHAIGRAALEEVVMAADMFEAISFWQAKHAIRFEDAEINRVALVYVRAEAGDFIAHAPVDLAVLLAENAALQKEKAQLREALTALEQARNALRQQAQTGRILLDLIDGYGWLDDLERDAAHYTKLGHPNLDKRAATVYKEVSEEVERQRAIILHGAQRPKREQGATKNE